MHLCSCCDDLSPRGRFGALLGHSLGLAAAFLLRQLVFIEALKCTKPLVDVDEHFEGQDDAEDGGYNLEGAAMSILF